jgi:putative two-component system response regulator
LYLLAGDLREARVHAQESGRLAKLAAVKRTMQRHEALLGLIDVRSGVVEKGLAAVEDALAFAKRVDHIDVADYLGMCADAHEAAGQSDRALEYLKELVEWKRKSIDAEVMSLQYEDMPASVQFQTGASVFDDALLVRSQRLHAGLHQRVQRLVETAINAEVASGHDLYRTFRMAKLSRCLATAIGWDEERIASLTWGGRLCNIGMMAIPSRILQKRRGLSDSERDVMRAHTMYGAELLRKSKLQVLDVAAVIAEQHHERYDGSGYPRGLSGEAIAEEARIVSVCDAFDTMTHRRPWRPHPLSVQAALNELKRGIGSQFDPQLADAFIALIRREFWEHDDFDAFLAEGADELEYVRARTRMETFIADRR